MALLYPFLQILILNTDCILGIVKQMDEAKDY